ncbi:hypothetical protein ACFZAC_09210 [Pseudomonas fluorescens]|uniref:hypothetical protein n=1 Tax=Pseudomonas fluorescens TaxID=294 RepID=UPI0037489C91
MDYPKSVPSVGLVGGKFVDEDPLAGTPGSLIPSQWGNGVTDELLNVITAAGLVPDELLNTQLLTALRSISRGIIGASSNVAMTIAGSASASGTMTADQIIVGTALNGLQYSLSSFNKTVKLDSVGAGGMDVGAAPVSGYVALYAIYNPTTKVSALLAVNATAVLAPTIYAGANMPAGYNASAFVGVWPTNASGQFVIGRIRNRSFQYTSGIGLTVVSRVTNQVSPLAVSLAGACPINALTCSGTLNGSSSTATTIATAVSTDSGQGDQQQATIAGATQIIGSFRDLLIATPQQMSYTVQALAGTPSFVINVTKYGF